MAIAAERRNYLERIDLLEEVVYFKKKYYPCAWASYDSAKPGSMKSAPVGERAKTLEFDYQWMETR